ncbi:MAG: ion transporter [Microcystaceae cyanobacterium]
MNPNSSLSLRQKLATYFNDLENPISIGVNLGILGLIFLSLVLFVAETYPLSPKFAQICAIADLIILGLFTLEYSLRVWCAENRLKFIFSFFAIIDLLSILPLFFGIVNLNFLRLIRWFRVLRIIRFAKLEASFLKLQSQDSLIFIEVFLTLFSVIFIYAGLIYQIEHLANPKVFNDFFDALYFTIVTMTTVGFGDVIPLSEQGRLLTVFMILSGIILIPWQIGTLTQQLLKLTRSISKYCPQCNLMNHDADANFCKICGTKLENQNSE